MANKNFEVKHGLSVAGTERITAAGAGSLTNLTLSGNLTVNGTTVTLDATTLQVADKNIVLNYHASNDTSSAADGAGITIQDADGASTDATLLWDAGNSEFDFSHTVTAPALTIAGAATFDGSTLAVDATNNRVGIGTNSPTQALDVNGTVELNNLTIAGAQGSDGQLLTSTGSGVGWEDAPASGPSKGLAIAFGLIF